MDPMLELLKRLTDHGVEFVVIGGLAATIHGSAIITHDVDVCVNFDELTRTRLTSIR